MRIATRAWGFSIGFVLLACGGSDDSADEPAPRKPEGGVELLGSDCDPIIADAANYCGLPFPSNVYLADDPTAKNASGKSVRFGATTLPARHDGTHFDPSLLHDHDGFSPSQAPMTYLRHARCDACATPYSIEKSLEPDHPTVLIEAGTHRRVPHWVDVDNSTRNDGLDDKPDQRLLMIRPAERLKDGTRYIVGIRDITDENGTLVEPTPVFQAIRDGKRLSTGTDAEKWTVYARRNLYKEIFAELDAAHVDKKSLQVAWDFTTATTGNITGHMIELRDKALAAVGEDGPEFVLDHVEEFPTPADNANLLRRIHIKMKAPLFLTSANEFYDPDLPLDRLNFGPDGKLVQNGTMERDVLILVPRSVESGQKHGLLQNGHGLFGSRFEGEGGYLATAANLNHYIAFSVNLFGFDEEADSLAIDGLLGRFEALKAFSERQIQGMVNQLVAMRLMMGRIAKQGIQDDKQTVLLDPAWIDPSVRAYRGDSQGGIMGATYMAVSTDVTRGLLGETGMPYNLLLNRSFDFPGFELMLEAGFSLNAVYTQIILGVIQMPWDRAEPSGFAGHIENDPLPGTPSHHVLLHIARGDHQVTTFGAHLMARAIGAVQLESDDPEKPFWEPIYGVESAPAPVQDRSVIVEYEFGLKPNPAVNKPNADGCDPHDRVRDLGPSYEQQDVFFRTGKVVWSCKGACDCNDDVANDPKEEDRCDQTYQNQCE